MSDEPLAIPLESIQSCFEGVIPSSICTVSADGTPNVTYLSLVQRVDQNHVALSRQFFNKTEQNTTVNPYAQVNVVEPDTRRSFHLDLLFERTETSGPLFEQLRTKLDAVAAEEGFTNIFRLRGVDICRVLSTALVPCKFPEGKPPRDVNLSRVEAFSRRIADVEDLDELFEATLEACGALFGYRHAFIMLVDEAGERLYTVESAGFPASGAGSEVRVGEGLIGLAAARHQSIRISNLARDMTYSHAVRDSGLVALPRALEQVIPVPSLPVVKSQLVTPMLAHRRLVGVLCVQSEEPGAFSASDECVAGIVANQVAMAMAAIDAIDRAAPSPVAAAPADAPGTIQVKHYREDDSVFIDNEYLIKGVAGGILWRLLQMYRDEQRVEFSNKEMRLDQSLDLPDIKDNLEARLILLRKRLEERSADLRIEKVARGRFRLVVTRPVALVEVAGGGPL